MCANQIRDNCNSLFFEEIKHYEGERGERRNREERERRRGEKERKRKERGEKEERNDIMKHEFKWTHERNSTKWR